MSEIFLTYLNRDVHKENLFDMDYYSQVCSFLIVLFKNIRIFIIRAGLNGELLKVNLSATLTSASTFSLYFNVGLCTFGSITHNCVSLFLDHFSDVLSREKEDGISSNSSHELNKTRYQLA